MVPTVTTDAGSARTDRAGNIRQPQRLGLRALPSARSELIASALNFDSIVVKDERQSGTNHGCIGKKQRPRKWAG